MRIVVLSMFEKLADDVNLDPFSRSYCRSRLKSEGVQFLTETLPKLSKAVLASLEANHFIRPTDFAWKGKSLRFFQSFLKGIFGKDGSVRSTVDADCLRRLRQFCEYSYKLVLPIKVEKNLMARAKFVSLENDIGFASLDAGFVNKIRKDFENFYPSLRKANVNDILTSNRPRPASGTYSGKQDFHSLSPGFPWFPGLWYTRRHLDYRVPRKYSGVGGYRRPVACAPCPRIYRETSHSEVLFVPKDSRGPRTIVREPFGSQSFQMGFHDWFTDELERVTHRRINFRDQLINRHLALEASIDRKNCTIDLKDASDSVSYSLVSTVFANSPGIMYFVKRTTRKYVLPDIIDGGHEKELHDLKKIAGMGSGVTFPTMSFLIHLAITRSIVDRTKLPYHKVAKTIYVYGDDIICPTIHYDFAVEGLNKIGLIVNQSKSFVNSSFRESCGGDYYCGQDVAPVRLKLPAAGAYIARGKGPLSIDFGSQSFALVDLEAHCRELVKAGYEQLSGYFYDVIERHYGKLPQVAGESPALGRYSLSAPVYGTYPSGEYKPVKAMFAAPVSKKCRVDDYIYLGSSLLRSEGLSRDLLRLNDVEDLKDMCARAGSSYGNVAIPRRIRIVRKRVSAYRLMG